MKTRTTFVVPLLGAATLALCLGPALHAQELDVDRSAKREIRFTSRTQVDEFEGVTDHIDGYVLLDGTPLSASTRGEGTELYLEVDLASLDTGIGLRNRHMRDNYLEVEEFPFATYQGSIASVEERPGGGARVTASGTFTVHGVPRERDVACDVTPAGEGYRARCAFTVLLSDHDIEIPRVMFLKLANEIQVDVAFTVRPVGDGGGGKP